MISQKNRSLTLMYHGLHESSSDSVGLYEPVYSVRPTEFAQHVRILRSKGWSIKNAMSNESEMGHCILTFDDGDSSNYFRAMPVLQEENCTAIFFVTTDRINSPGCLTSSQIEEMARLGMSIQSHGKTHEFLTSLSDSDLRNELSSSKMRLEDITSLAVTELSAPGGRVDQRVIMYAREAGYLRIYGSRPGLNTDLGTSEVNDSIWSRVPVRGSTSLAQFTRLASLDSVEWLLLMSRWRMANFGKRLLGQKRYDWVYKRVVKSLG